MKRDQNNAFKRRYHIKGEVQLHRISGLVGFNTKLYCMALKQIVCQCQSTSFSPRINIQNYLTFSNRKV